MAQSPTTETQLAASSDSQALTILSEAAAATNGSTNFSDARINSNAEWFLGSKHLVGTTTLQSKGGTEARMDLSVGSQSRSEVRNDSGAIPAGNWTGWDGKTHLWALHNLWTPGAWFSPSSILAFTNASGIIAQFVGAETWSGIAVDHVRVSRRLAGQSDASNNLTQKLSTIDLLFDSGSHLLLSAVFDTHPETNAGVNIREEVRFANYQRVSGIQVPYRIQRLMQGTLNLDLTVTNAAINSGLSDTVFAVQ